MGAEAATGADAAAVLATIRAELIDAGVDEEAITPGAPLDGLGLDSLDFAQILAAVRTRHEVTLQQPDLVGVTVAQLVAKVVASSVP